MGMLDELVRFITQGSFQGFPAIVVMAIPLILGLIVGFFVKKMLKIAIIAAIVLVVLTYLGFFNLSWGSLKEIIDTYGPQVVNYAILLFGMLPLSIGFIIGLIVGFLFT